MPKIDLGDLVTNLNREIIVQGLTQIASGQSIIDPEWQRSTGQTTIGHLLYFQKLRHYVLALDINAGIRDYLDDLVMTLVVLGMSRLLADKSIFETSWLLNVFYISIGVTVYHIILEILRKYHREPPRVFQDMLETACIMVLSMYVNENHLSGFSWVSRALMTLGSVVIYHYVVGPISNPEAPVTK